MARLQPDTAEQAAEALRTVGADGRSVRFRGGGTKAGWGRPAPAPDVEISTLGLNRILEHNEADLTAVLEAGVPFAEAQAAFAEAGQRLALDPPLGPGGAATIGGVVATADSGPLRHRYGAPRDLLLGATVALSDGTVAASGGKVIKNVAGYDVAKLLAGSFGTLGLVTRVALRLHPLPPSRVSAMGESADAGALRRAATAVAAAPLEAEALDVAWSDGAGRLLARMGGAAAGSRAGRAAALMRGEGLDTVIVDDDEDLWHAQREGQRSASGTVVRVSGVPAGLLRVLETAGRLGASVVGRAGMGTFWVRLPDGGPEEAVAGVEEFRRDLAPHPCAVLDAPAEVREKVDVWGVPDGPEVRLMARLKERFDPTGTCNPGMFVGGI